LADIFSEKVTDSPFWFIDKNIKKKFPYIEFAFDISALLETLELQVEFDKAHHKISLKRKVGVALD